MCEGRVMLDHGGEEQVRIAGGRSYDLTFSPKWKLSVHFHYVRSSMSFGPSELFPHADFMVLQERKKLN